MATKGNGSGPVNPPSGGGSGGGTKDYNIRVSIQDDNGSKVVQRNLQDIGTSAAASGSAVQQLNAQLKSVDATAELEATAAAAQTATDRIKDMVQASLQRVEAENAAIAAATSNAEATTAATEAVNGYTQATIRATEAGSAQFATYQAATAAYAELEAAIANGITSADELTAAQTNLDKAQAAGILTLEEYTAAQAELAAVEEKLLATQGKSAAAVQALLSKYDPLSSKMAQLAADELKLNEAVAAGTITQEAAALALAGIEEKRQALTDGINKMSGAASAATKELGIMSGEVVRGNFTRLEGSMITLANRTGFLAQLFSPLGASILGVVAVLGLLVATMVAGEEELQKFNSAIVMTGNYAGVTRDQYNQMAEQIAGSNGTIGTAKTTLASLTESGRYTADQMYLIGTAAVEMADATGRSVDSILGDFKKLSDEPLKASQQLNEQYHYLTQAVYDQIKALQDQGEQQAAVDLAERTYAEAMTNRSQQVEQNLNDLGKAWRELKKDASETWQAMLGWDQAETDSSRLQNLGVQFQDLDNYIKQLQAKGMTNSGFFNGGTPIEELEKQRANLMQQMIDLQNKINAPNAADDAAAQKQAEAASIAASAHYDQKYGSLSKLTEKQKELNDLTKTYETMWENNVNGDNYRLANVTRDAQGNFHGGQFDTDVAAVNNKFKDPTAKADLQAQVQAVKDTYSQINDIYTNSEKVLVAQNKAGQVSNKDYFDSLETMYQQQAQFQIESLAKQNEVLEHTKATGAERISLDRQIATNKVQMEKIEQDSIAKTQELEAQRMDSLKKLNDAYAAVQVNASAYTALRDRQNARQVASYGLGSDAQQLNTQLQQVEDTYERFKETLTRDAQKNGLIDSDAFKQQISNIDQLEQAELERERGRFQQRLQAEQNWSAGASQALQNYIDKGQQAGAEVGQGISQSLNDAAQSFTDFLNTGTFSMKKFGTDILNTFEQIMIKQLVMIPIAKELNSLLSQSGGGGGGGGGFMSSLIGLFTGGGGGGGGGFGGFGYADGGVSTGKQMALVSEGAYSNEAHVPLPDGRAIPVSLKGGGGGGGNVGLTVQIYQGDTSGANGNNVSTQTTQDGQGMMLKVFLGEVSKSIMNGGVVAKSIEQRYPLRRSANQYT